MGIIILAMRVDHAGLSGLQHGSRQRVAGCLKELGDGGDLGVENKFCHPSFSRQMLILSATKKFTKAGPKFLRPKHWQSSSFSIDDAEYDLAVAPPPNSRNCVDFAQGRFENGRQQEHSDER